MHVIVGRTELVWRRGPHQSEDLLTSRRVSTDRLIPIRDPHARQRIVTAPNGGTRG
jgi:hypothetical protein